MKLYTKMPERLVPFYRKELDMAQRYLPSDLKISWRHLEMAHILGQPYPLEHTFIHWRMLQFGFRIKSIKEIMGQLPRLAVGGVKSFVGIIPVGNTGGADVPPMRPMPIPDELQAIIDNNLK